MVSALAKGALKVSSALPRAIMINFPASIRKL
jgi:hypothetical protein